MMFNSYQAYAKFSFFQLGIDMVEKVYTRNQWHKKMILEAQFKYIICINVRSKLHVKGGLKQQKGVCHNIVLVIWNDKHRFPFSIGHYRYPTYRMKKTRFFYINYTLFVLFKQHKCVHSFLLLSKKRTEHSDG